MPWTFQIHGTWHNVLLAEYVSLFPHGVMAAHGSLEPLVLVRIQVGERSWANRSLCDITGGRQAFRSEERICIDG